MRIANLVLIGALAVFGWSILTRLSADGTPVGEEEKPVIKSTQERFGKLPWVNALLGRETREAPQTKNTYQGQEGRPTTTSEKCPPVGLVPKRVKAVVEIWESEIKRAAEAHSIDWRLVAAVVTVESNGNPAARSTAGALGLMQIKPSTAKLYYGLGESDLYRPQANLRAGTAYLVRQIRQSGSVRAGLHRYSNGPATKASLDENPYVSCVVVHALVLGLVIP